MKNFILGAMTVLLVISLSVNLFWFGCPQAKRVYIKSSPSSGIIEITPQMLIPQLETMKPLDKSA